MYCQHCGNKLEQSAQFCQHCGNSTSPTITPTKQQYSGVLIKCANCGYNGKPEYGRQPILEVLAWIAVFFAPMITLLYFVATYKYRCPKCKATSIEVQNKNGVYFLQRKPRRLLLFILWILIIIAIIGVVSSIILASLNNAREKVRQQTEATQINQTTDFSVVLFRPNFMLSCEGYPMKVHKNQRFLTLPSPPNLSCGATH